MSPVAEDSCLSLLPVCLRGEVDSEEPLCVVSRQFICWTAEQCVEHSWKQLDLIEHTQSAQTLTEPRDRQKEN